MAGNAETAPVVDNTIDYDSKSNLASNLTTITKKHIHLRLHICSVFGVFDFTKSVQLGQHVVNHPGVMKYGAIHFSLRTLFSLFGIKTIVRR